MPNSVGNATPTRRPCGATRLPRPSLVPPTPLPLAPVRRRAAVGLASAIAAVIALGAAGDVARAQAPGPGAVDGASRAIPRRELRAVRVAPGAIRLDGRLDDAAWADAPVATDFTQAQPRAGAPATQRTEARVAYDAQNIYVAMRLWDAHPDSIATQLARRDVGDIYADWAYVGFDSFLDRRTSFAFGVSAAGQQYDVFRFNDATEDLSWDAVWQSAVQRDDRGWTAEWRIPLSQLRFTAPADGGSPRWGVNFGRILARNDETSLWNPTPPDQPGVTSRFGDLVGLEELTAPSRLELVPYARSQVETQPPQPGNPFVRGTTPGAAVGLDVRYRLPAGLTLTGSVNPDFGQVEADPAVVNLTQFEVFFPERRPFFLEGTDIFRFGGTVTSNDNSSTTYFYSRRIGRAPRAPVGDDVAFADVPRATAIDGALKVSGKTSSGLTVGLLAAATAEEFARVRDRAGLDGSRPVEPGSAYGVTRLRQDFRDGNTVIGGFGSVSRRALDNAVYLPILPREALVGGADFEHAWDRRTWTVSGFLAGSRVAGDRSFITRLQRSPVRQYQRPDQAYLRVDSTATSLGGWAGALSVAKTGGRRLLASATYEATSPGFEVNELGFQTRADFHSLSTSLIWRTPEQTARFRESFLGLFTTHARNGAGTRVEERYAAFASAVLPSNLWEGSLLASWSPTVFDDRRLRGGPLTRAVEQWRVEAELTGDPRRPVVWGSKATFRRDVSGEWDHSLGVELDLRPSPSVRLRVAPTYRDQYDTDQYVTAVADATSPMPDRRRYVFGDIRQAELSTVIRADWTFTPYLSLQVVAQPFVAAGRFDRYKEFTTPGEFRFRTYVPLVRDGETVTVDPDGAGPASAFSFAEQDFTVRALRGNAVLRWEYRPGATVFVVWQQQREGADATARLGIRDDLPRIFRDSMRNVFLVKASFWFQP